MSPGTRFDVQHEAPSLRLRSYFSMAFLFLRVAGLEGLLRAIDILLCVLPKSTMFRNMSSSCVPRSRRSSMVAKN